MILEPIGVINTPYKTKEECPIQPLYSSDFLGSMEVFNLLAAPAKRKSTNRAFLRKSLSMVPASLLQYVILHL